MTCHGIVVYCGLCIKCYCVERANKSHLNRILKFDCWTTWTPRVLHHQLFRLSGRASDMRTIASASALCPSRLLDTCSVELPWCVHLRLTVNQCHLCKDAKCSGRHERWLWMLLLHIHTPRFRKCDRTLACHLHRVSRRPHEAKDITLLTRHSVSICSRCILRWLQRLQHTAVRHLCTPSACYFWTSIVMRCLTDMTSLLLSTHVSNDSSVRWPWPLRKRMLRNHWLLCNGRACWLWRPT